MKIKARFLGQGFSIKTNSIINIVSERKENVLIEQNGKLIGIYPKNMIKKIKKERIK